MIQSMKAFILSALLALCAFCCIGQPGNLGDANLYRITRTNSDYSSVMYHNNRVYAINERGEVVIWDLSTLDTLAFRYNDTLSYRFLCVTIDKHNVIHFGTDKGHIFRFQPTNAELSLYKKLKYPVHHIFFNSDNYPLVITPYAVYDPITKRKWSKFKNHTSGLIRKKKVLGMFQKMIDEYFQVPHYAFLDSKDRLWMTACFGEFGGDVQIFDAKNFRIAPNKFDSVRPGLIFPRSVFEGPNRHVFLTSGLQHFSNSGEIYKFDHDKSVRKIFNSSGIRKVDRKTGKVISEGGLFIGPGAYNVGDSCIYFATTKGIHKIKASEDRPTSASLVIAPMLEWGREPLAIGVSMNIKRMEFLSDGKLLFLTAKDGIGILDHGKITFFR
jgi:hypothetical protein